MDNAWKSIDISILKRGEVKNQTTVTSFHFWLKAAFQPCRQVIKWQAWCLLHQARWKLALCNRSQVLVIFSSWLPILNIVRCEIAYENKLFYLNRLSVKYFSNILENVGILLISIRALWLQIHLWCLPCHMSTKDFTLGLILKPLSKIHGPLIGTIWLSDEHLSFKYRIYFKEGSLVKESYHLKYA